jgi:penicillin G amidase
VNVTARRTRQPTQYGNVVVALAASACLLGLLGFGFAAVPALGRALVPGHGAWTSATGAKLPGSETLTLAGLTKPVRVSFTSAGLASIDAQSDDDAFLALGYVHAEFRLTEMDLERRLTEGKLAQLVGPAGVASDKFELRLGLLRTAQQEWAQLPKTSPAARVLVAYSRGVNDYLARLRVSRQWPAVFSLTGVYPSDWTPVDSLAVQGGLTQGLDFTTTPLDYALLERSLGAQLTMAWLPLLPPNQQSPYDPGPYRYLGLAPISGAQSLTDSKAGGRPRSRQENQPAGTSAISSGLARAASAILAQASALPAGQIYAAPASNAWAASGPKVAGGGAMLAGDPHLLQTLPSIWYQVALTAPGLAVSGVSVPGLPAVLIGQNAHIAWSLTDAQSQATLFYDEQTSKSRPGQYFWRGQWRRMQVLHYQIDVRGGAPVQLYVDQTVHGPVLTQAGQTVSVDWMGALGSPDEAAFLAIDEASDFGQFKAALADWRSPALNFVYADDLGNIGAIAAGYYPQVRQGDPWLPMPGSGADDVAGVIPYAAVPQVYDPASHVIASANQRPVGDSYPYYLGTAASFYFDPGYRANAEYAYLGSHWSMRPASFTALQSDLGDQLAGQIVPKLLAALKLTARQGTPLTALQQLAEQALASWNGQMAVGSGAASIWWTFWTDYLTAVFQPWWTAAKVPVHLDRSGLAVGPDQFSLDEDLEAWTLGDQQNAAFSPPGAPPRTADQVMRTAFDTAVSHLATSLGGGPGRWQWGKLHTREFPSLTAAAALGYGPRPAGGDFWTVDAAEGGMNSEIGPSWRMIAAWAGVGDPVAECVYPGGQSENPASPWYSNLIGDWWAGTYLPMPAAGSGAARVTSGLRP